MVILSGGRGAVARPPLRLDSVISLAKEAMMECDICGQDVENSEDLLKHMERVHPTGAGDKSMDNLEKPDHLGETPEESAEREVPKPTH
jgi:hypothetical protein